MSSDDSPSRHSVVEALDAARQYLAEYNSTVQAEAASKGTPPDASGAVRRAHVEVNNIVLYLFNLLRADIRKEMPEYWERAILYRDRENEIEIRGLRSLQAFEGAYNERQHWELKRQQGLVMETRAEPVLIPVPALRQAVYLMGEVAKEVGYTADVAVKHRTVNVPTDPYELDE